MTRIKQAVCLLIALSALGRAEPAQAEWVRYALVIGYNESDDTDLAPLRYADDDAVKYSEVLGLTTEKTVLLTDLDVESERVFSVQASGSPTRSAVRAALRTLREDMAKAAAEGAKPVLYFVYSGHGNYDQEGRGYVHLKDGRFTTRDLYYEVFGPTSGPNPHHVVLIVDACNAALLVNSRGGGSDRRRVRGTSLKLEDYPNVGVILSSSTVAEVHEWGRYLSGIFSHEVRSGLLGPADLNDNREIDFVELAAFVAAANAEVRNETYRVRPYIRPPLSAPNMPLVSLDNARFTRRIRLGAGLSGRAHLMNAELLRYADFHKGAQQNFWLGVPGQGEFVLVHQGQEYLIPADASGELELGDLQRRENTAVAARGTDQYFEERLFAQAHSASQAQDWLQARYLESLVVERFETLPWYHNAGAWSLFGTGLATLGGAVGMHVAARGAADDAHAAPWYAERTDAIDRAGRYQNTAIALYAVGGAAALSSVLWFALEEPVEARRYEPPFRIQVGPGGVQLSAEF